MKIRCISLIFALSATVVGCSSAEPRVVTIREADLPPKEISEIDELRKEVGDRTKLGKGETKPWNERYQGENPDKPFQGSPEQHNRRPAHVLE